MDAADQSAHQTHKQRGFAPAHASADGSKGDGVAIHDKEGDGRDTRELFEELLRGKPLIIEELVVQDPRMAAFHPSSVNTMRVMTWYDGGEMTILYALVRMGRGGSVIDNASAGGVIAAVDRESGTIMNCSLFPG